MTTQHPSEDTFARSEINHEKHVQEGICVLNVCGKAGENYEKYLLMRL